MKDARDQGAGELGRARSPDARLAAVLFALTSVAAWWLGTGLSNSPQVLRESRLSDGEAPAEGSPWDAEQAAALRSPAASAVVDLGSEQRDVRIFLQADANDTYRIEASSDGRHYETVWDAGPLSGGGLRSRASEPHPRLGRYLRIRPIAGDAAYSVGELAVALGPGLTPPWRWVPVTSTSDLRANWWLLVGAGLAVALAGAALRSARARATAMLLGGVACAVGGHRLSALGPLVMQDELIVGSLAAALAILALLLERTDRGARTRGPLVALAAASALSFGAFFHYGAGQLPDARDASRTRIHYADLRNYFPTAKYFEELGYSGVYRASVLTWVATRAGGDLDAAQAIVYRDLDTHRMTSVGSDRAGLEQLRSRFTATRFEALRSDMEYFRALMGDALYAGSMIDHGGNATPLWLAVARLVFAGQPASDGLFELTGWLDVAALLLLLICVERTYGVRNALVVGLVFGALEFPNISNNWAGATLRHDWLVLFGLGLCALRTARFSLAGALLMGSAAIRAFPALGLVLSAGALGVAWWSSRRAGEAATAARAQALRRLLSGAVGCAAAAAILSVLLLDAGAWFEWLRKVRLLSAEPHLNHIGLPTFIYHLRAALQTQHAPSLISILGIVASLAVLPFALIRALRGGGHDAAIWGLLLVPLVSNPANYYAHFLCLVPLLGASLRMERLAPAGWVMLTHAALTAPFFAGSAHDARHFERLSLMYVATLGALLLAERLVPAAKAKPASGRPHADAAASSRSQTA